MGVSILLITLGILEDQFIIGIATITHTRVTLILMTLTIVSVPMITINDQFILGTVNTTIIKVIAITVTLTSQS